LSSQPDFTVEPGDPAWNDCGDLNGDGIINPVDYSFMLGLLSSAAGNGYTIPCQ
jgi:hypothetical protein